MAVNGVLRLTVHYDGQSLTLVDQTSVDMTPIASDPINGYAGQTGAWYELQDSGGKTLYRRIVADPTIGYAEVFAPDGSLTHAASSGADATLDLVVPQTSDGSSVVFFATQQPAAAAIGTPEQEQQRAAEPRIGIGAAREIARFNVGNIA